MDSSVLPPPYAGELHFVHNDIATEHIFVDPETGRLVGLLDFGDAVFGDPAIDFASLPSQLGWEATEAALRTYSIPIDRGFRDRLEFMSRANPLIWLHDTHLQNGDVEKHRRWVLNAFGSA
jgi:aminoglycoside phosphotransferase (APT) family kinase protein